MSVLLKWVEKLAGLALITVGGIVSLGPPSGLPRWAHEKGTWHSNNKIAKNIRQRLTSFTGLSFVQRNNLFSNL